LDKNHQSSRSQFLRYFHSKWKNLYRWRSRHLYSTRNP